MPVSIALNITDCVGVFVYPRIETKARALLRDRTLTKLELADIGKCHVRTSQRILSKLHRLGVCKIVAWTRSHQSPLPVYGTGEEDVPRPIPLTAAEQSARRRLSEEVRLVEAYRKRQKRYLESIKRRSNEQG
jgi:hypothetical protein